MAVEKARTMSVRKIRPDPTRGKYVSLKVIDKISFVDPKSQYQEFEFTFYNTPTANRKVHTEEVGTPKLKVERIDNVNILDRKDQYQESIFSYLLYSEGVHLKTHKTKIYALYPDGTKNESTWIEVERVDQIRFIDPKTQYQEYIYQLNWPDLDDPEWDYGKLGPVVTDYDKTEINPPWRIDPFQNIVDAKFEDFQGWILFQNANVLEQEDFKIYINGIPVLNAPYPTVFYDGAFYAQTHLIKIGAEANEMFYPFLDNIDSYLQITGGNAVTYETFVKSPLKEGEINTIYFENVNAKGLESAIHVFYRFADSSGELVPTTDFIAEFASGASGEYTLDLRKLK